jgi:hypothetical protein
LRGKKKGKVKFVDNEAECMDLSFLKGKGVNAGTEEIEGIGAEQYYAEPGNLYTLLGKYKPESLDFVVSRNMIFGTKYHRILLKEWMNACRVGGRVAILFRERGAKNLRFLLLEIFALYGNSVEVDHGAGKNGEMLVVISKKEPALADGDSIDKWTFGILSNGSRDENVDGIIDSILMQDIPKFEIIVCGKYANKKKYAIKYLPFSEKDELGWITKKKNLIMENAKYENAMVMHDRIFLGKGWHAGMKEYGNYFDVLSCVLISRETGKRAGDWIANIPGILGHLDYSDWDESVRINGAYIILKKSAWRKAPWNEHLFWNEAEDFELSERQNLAGVVPRLNPRSVCYTPGSRFKYMEFEKDTQKLGRLKVPVPQGIYMLALRAYLKMPKGVQDLIKRIKGGGKRVGGRKRGKGKLIRKENKPL